MKAVILAGGLGTRLSEETSVKPKPMVEIGGKPILWHIMQIYSFHGVNEFIICCGYKGYLIKEYFANYFLHMSDITLNMQTNEMTVHNKRTEPWLVTLIDTGERSMTGGRLRRVRDYIVDDDEFLFTYGDGLSDIDIEKTIAFHRQHGKMATITAAHLPGRFGALEINNHQVKKFKEKPKGDGGMINGGFFVLSPGVINYIADDETIWERHPLTQLALDGQLMAYEHSGFWHPMDTMADKHTLQSLWANGTAPWKKWK